MRRAELIHMTLHDFGNHLFHRPVVRDEAPGQMIQQREIRRRLAGFTKVIRRLDDARAEKVLPDAVHHHTGGQRILRARDPCREFEPAALLGIHRFGLRIHQHLRKSARDDLAKLRVLTADVDGAVRRFHIAQSHDGVRHGGVVALAHFLVALFLRVGLVRERLHGRITHQHLLHLRLDVFYRHLLRCEDAPLLIAHLEPRIGEVHAFAQHDRQILVAKHDRAVRERQQAGGERIALAIATGSEHRLAAGKNPRECVVVARRNGIELVVVTFRARQRQSQKGATGDVDLLVRHRHAEAVTAILPQVLDSDCEKACRDELFVALRTAVRTQQVASKLLTHELIVGLVGVQRIDDPVAIAKRQREQHIVTTAARLRIAGDIQPVATPALTKARRIQQLFNLRLEVPGWCLIRRQTGQIKSDPAVHLLCRGIRDRTHPLRLERGKNESIHVRLRPRSVLHGWNLRFGDGLKGPVLATLLDVDRACDGLRHSVPRIGRAPADPLFKIRDDFGRKPLLRGHLEIALIVHGLDQQAALHISGHHGRCGVAALANPLARVEQQTAFDLLRLRRVAGVAFVDQHRTDARLEESEVFRSDRRRGGQDLDERRSHEILQSCGARFLLRSAATSSMRLL